MKPARPAYHWILSCLCLIALLCCGCGNDGPLFTRSTEDPLSPGDPPVPPVPERSQVLRDITTFINAAENLDQDEGLVELAYFLVEQPGVVGSKLADDGSVWALFEDGQLLVFVNNREVASPTTRELLAPSLRTDSQIPRSAVAHFANTFEGSPTFSSPVGDLSEQAHSSGYQVRLGGGVEQLRQLKSLGTLYIDAHGASSAEASSPDGKSPVRGLTLKLPVPSSFAIWTQTLASEELDLHYQQELESQSLIHFIAPIDGESYERRYGITGKFVRENWTFLPDSLVFVNACTSNSFAFREACMQVGASAYLGWSKEVGDGLAFDSASTLYSLLFPGDRVPEVSTLDEALAQISSLGLDLDQQTGARLVVTRAPSFGLLVPSLRSLQVVDGEIILRGYFGAAVGQVLIDGVAQPLSRPWDAQVLTLSLPEEGTHLRVRVGGRLSNSMIIPRPEPEDDALINLEFGGSGRITNWPGRPDLVGSELRITLSIENSQVVDGRISVSQPAGFDYFFVGDTVVNTLRNGALTSVQSVPGSTTTYTIPLPSQGQTTAQAQFHFVITGEGQSVDDRGDFEYEIDFFSQP